MRKLDTNVIILNHGGYDGARKMKFPLKLRGWVSSWGTVDVPIADLIYHGYDFSKGQAAEVKDCDFMSESLTFNLGSEALIEA